MMIITFLLTPLGRKIGLSVLLVLLMSYGYRRITNEAYEVGRAEGQRDAWVGAEERNRALWLAEQQKLNEQKQALDKKAKQLSADRQQQSAAREALETNFNATLAQLEQQRRDLETITVPDSDLVPRIRELLNELRPKPPGYRS